MTDQFEQARQCQHCINWLPLEPRPIIQGSSSAKLLIISQAPGIKAHLSNIPWNDKSGDRLRSWLGIDTNTFYDPEFVAIMPMSFCYPGKGKSGDLAPVRECAPIWHPRLLSVVSPEITILIGKHAQDHYLADAKPLTKRVQSWRDYQPDFFVLPHPSPRNNIWLKKNPWFESDVLPCLRAEIQQQIQRL